MNNSEITAVGFLIFPGFPMSCLTSIIEPLRAANEIAERETFSWQLISETGSKVTSSAGVIFEPDVALSAKLDPAMIFLLSGPLSEFEAPRASNSVLRKLERTGAVLGGISGGVFPLVKSGVMEGYKCSVHWCYEAAFKSEFPEMLASGEVIVTDRRRYTASGAAAAFDLTLQLIEERLGPDIALEVACWFQHPMMRGEGVEQRVPLKPSTDPALPDLVGRAVEMFVERLDEPRSVGDIAKALGVTPRQVERAFKKATGQSPSHYFRALRMNAARQLVLYSKDSMAQVAAAVGFSTTTPFVNHYRDAFGVTPKQDRGRINAFRVQGNMPLPST
ncbi:GlxA family transcriptional regulator [uncultured Litoreibacter sp.]|uniref:GlxA family transcriptional regulator n=1 Tax=uncultured Litoreibacter sp. TaxID=1392394 RepID=UPI002625F851|nr:GlxA family transcriptional regulator [uncultured Litoreibacter sp.]